MREINLAIILLIISTINVIGQEDNQALKQEVEIKVDNWFNNPKIDSTSNFDLSIMDHLKDSGEIINVLREGKWIYYYVDSTQIGNTVDVFIGNDKFKMAMDPKIEKHVGSYKSGKKDGIWIKYEADGYKHPISWIKKSQTSYKNNLKHGKEIFFQGFDNTNLDTIAISIFTKGENSGFVKLFYQDPPYGLKEVYAPIQTGESYLNKRYDTQGNLEIEYNDTLIDDTLYFYFAEYFENGNVKSSGFLLDSKLDKIYREFHDNGELFIEYEYNKGKLWNINKIMTIDGINKPIGDFHNGNGHINVYDENGQKVEEVKYINGVQQEE